MEGTAQRLADLSLTVVGDVDGALVSALRAAGARPRTAALHELARHGGAHLVFIGKAAVDGGKHALANAPAGTSATVVLPRGAAAERIAAVSLGLRVVEPAEPGQLARAILEGIHASPTTDLGWTELGSLLDAFAARIALRLGADRSRGLRLKLGDAGEVAALLERHAADLVGLCEETRAPDSLGPSVAVDELSWDDDPQTQRLEDDEVARWRRLSARGEASPSPKVIRGLTKSRREDSGKWARGDSSPPADEVETLDAPTSDIVAAQTAPVRLPGPGRLPSGVIPASELELEDDDPKTMPATFPLPLVQRVDHDIDETAPRPAITDHAPISDEDLELGTDTLIRDELPDLPPPPGVVDEPPVSLSAPPSERATVPERPPLPAPAPPRPATPPPAAPEGSLAASPRPSRLPLLFGLGVVALGVVAAIVGVGLFTFGGSDSLGAMATVAPTAPPAEVPAMEERADAPSVEVRAPVAPPSAEEGAVADEAMPALEVEALVEDAVEDSVETPVAAAPAATDEETLRARSDALVEDGQRAEREGDWAAARTAYQAAIEIFDHNPHAHAGLARERLQMQDAETALFHAERAAALRRRRAEYQVLIGRAQRLAGNAAAARAAFDRALELDPNDREALRALSP
ncbi:MAG: hypothetical protein R3B82_08720 [Sandaracinaceae bacterium]